MRRPGGQHSCRSASREKPRGLCHLRNRKVLGADKWGWEKAKEVAHQSLWVIFSEQVGAMEGQILTCTLKDFTLAVSASGMQLRVTGTRNSKKCLFLGTFCYDPGET